MSYREQKDQSEARATAAAEGLTAFFPLPNQIFLDMDEGYVRSAVVKRLQENGISLRDELVTISKSGRSHVYYRVDKDLSDTERTALQACLGSDPVREAWAIIRIRQGSSAPIALFETSEWAKRVSDWQARL